MSVRSIDVALFKKMVINGAVNLKNNSETVNLLNVFPVPDGDTGTNMSMTIMSGVRELEACESSSIIEVAKVVSRGALMGARGNSGVILSQFFRGLYVGLKDLQDDKLNLETFMTCLESGRKIAYKAVMEPVEGTILTVIREATEATRNNFESFDSIDAIIDFYFEEAKKSLNNTPNLLPVLKEAGVVDSGGSGFCYIIEGFKLAIEGKNLEVSTKTEAVKQEIRLEETKYRYDLDFTLELKHPEKFDGNELKSSLSLFGDTLSVVKNENKAKVHVHTDKPGKTLDICQKHGEFLNLKIDNLKASKQEKEAVVEAPKKEIALVSVCFGDGIVSTFKEMGVDYVIEGGQTMNPSTEAFVEAIKAVNAKNVIIIPNNGNVIMAANQAASMVDSNVKVIKAKTIAQGFSSLMYFDPESDIDTNVSNMEEAIVNVTSGEITYSIRDTEIKGVKISANDYMGIADGEIIVSTKAKSAALEGLLKNIINDGSHMVTFFCGKDVTDEESSKLEELCTSINSDLDVEIIEGKQDIYSYIIAVE